MTNSITIAIEATTAQATSDIDRLKGKLDDVHTSKGFSSVVMGVGMGVGMAAWNAVGMSIGQVTNFLGDAVRAAMESETSITKLDQALQTNVKGWDGNRDAIERVLKERMKLGFSDEAQRNSLSVLVAKTRDVSQALDIQRVAMDLARLKGMDLATATSAISKGMSGQGRALIDLGINVREYTNKAEVLNAVQAKAAGQAEEFGKTTAGALEAMNVQIDEAKEAIGIQLLPHIRDLANFINITAVPAVIKFADAMGRLSDDTDKEVAAVQSAAGWLSNFVDGLLFGDDAAWSAARAAAGLEAALVPLADAEYGAGQRGREMAAALAAATAQAAGVASAAQAAADAERRVGDQAFFAAATLPKLSEAFRETARAARDNRLDDAWELKELPLKILIAKDEIVAAAKAVNDARTAEDRRAAQLRLLEAKKNLQDLQNQLTDAKTDAATAGAAVGNAYGGGMFAEIARWAKLVAGEVHDLGGPATPGTPGPGPTKRASGGPVLAGRPYIVGELGPEVFIPGQSGTIATGGGGVSIAPGAIVVNGSGDPDAVARAVLLALRREVSRQGMSLG